MRRRPVSIVPGSRLLLATHPTTRSCTHAHVSAWLRVYGALFTMEFTAASRAVGSRPEGNAGEHVFTHDLSDTVAAHRYMGAYMRLRCVCVMPRTRAEFL